MGWLTKPRNRPSPLRTHPHMAETAGGWCWLASPHQQRGNKPRLRPSNLIHFLGLQIWQKSLSLLMPFPRTSALGSGAPVQGTRTLLRRSAGARRAAPLPGHPVPSVTRFPGISLLQHPAPPVIPLPPGIPLPPASRSPSISFLQHPVPLGIPVPPAPRSPSIPLPQAVPCPAPQLDRCLEPSPTTGAVGKAMKVSVDELKPLWNSYSLGLLREKVLP